MRGWCQDVDALTDVEDCRALRRGPLGHPVEAGLLLGRKLPCTFGDVEGNRGGRTVNRPLVDVEFLVVDALDLSPIEASIHAKDPRGPRPYHPRMMTALLLYGYCVGVMSSRKIEAATYRDVAFRVLAGGNHPDHSVVSEFRRQHLSTLEGLFVQTVLAAQKLGLVKLGRVGLDGTKVKANASKHKAMSYERMLKAEAALREEIEQRLLLAEQTDQEEDARHGRGKRGDEVPEELRRRESRRSTIQAAMAELDADAAKAQAQADAQKPGRQGAHVPQAEDQARA